MGVTQKSKYSYYILSNSSEKSDELEQEPRVNLCMGSLCMPVPQRFLCLNPQNSTILSITATQFDRNDYINVFKRGYFSDN